MGTAATPAAAHDDCEAPRYSRSRGYYEDSYDRGYRDRGYYNDRYSDRGYSGRYSDRYYGDRDYYGGGSYYSSSYRRPRASVYVRAGSPRVYRCDDCGHRFASSYWLTYHQRHTGCD